MIVTKIEVQKNNKNRVNVYCDNEFAFALQTEILLKHSIGVGTELSEQIIKQLINESDKMVCVSKATEYVSKGLKTTKQVKEFLTNKGYNSIAISAAINQLTEYNLLDDSAYINAYVNDHKSYGQKKLKQDLYKKGVSHKLISEFFEKNYQADIEHLQNLADKYLKNKEHNHINMLKCKQYLLSKGFTYEDIEKVNFSAYEGWDSYASWD